MKTNMKNLDVFIDNDDKAELKALLDAHSVTWHESKVMTFSASAPDVFSFIIQTGAVASLAAVVMKWLDVKKGRRVKITRDAQGNITEIDSTLPVRELGIILSHPSLNALQFTETKAQPNSANQSHTNFIETKE